MPNYTFPVTVRTKDGYYAPGEPVSLPKKDGEELTARLGSGPSPVSAAASQAPEAPEPPVKPTGKDLDAALAGVIKTLDLKDPEPWTGTGAPSVAVLEKILGYDVTAAERDAAWDAVRKENPDLFGGAA